MKKFISYKRSWFFLMLPISLVALYLFSLHPDWSEWYSVTLYPLFSLTINRISSIFPFSLMECILAILIVFLPVLLIRLIVQLIRNKQERKERLRRAMATLFCALGIVSLCFTLNCGLNYSRYPFAQVTGLAVRPSSTDELKALCTELAQRANQERVGIETDNQGVTILSDRNKAAETARITMNSMEKTYPTLKSGYGKPKLVMASRVMSYLNITGIYFPFTVESNVNIDAPAYNIPVTMLHELSHVRGYMREDEANFIAYLACQNSNSQVFAYSGTMLAFLYANNSLYSVDESAGKETYALLNDGARKDLAANQAYWKRFEGPVAEVASKANDTYLKANRQEDGVKSYGRMVDLLLADYRLRHGLQ